MQAEDFGVSALRMTEFGLNAKLIFQSTLEMRHG